MHAFFSSPILFSCITVNKSYRTSLMSALSSPVKSFLSTAVIDIDTSGIHAFEDLHTALQKHGVQVSKSP